MVFQTLLRLLHEARPRGDRWVSALLDLRALACGLQTAALIDRLVRMGQIELRKPEDWQAPFAIPLPLLHSGVLDDGFRTLVFRFRYGGLDLIRAAASLAAIFESARTVF